MARLLSALALALVACGSPAGSSDCAPVDYDPWDSSETRAFCEQPVDHYKFCGDVGGSWHLCEGRAPDPCHLCVVPGEPGAAPIVEAADAGIADSQPHTDD